MAAQLIERAKLERGPSEAPTPLEYLLAEMWDPEQPKEIRRAAAVACLPYIHPRLQSIDVTSEEDRTLRIQFVDFAAVSQVSAQSQPMALPTITQDAAVVMADDDAAD